MYRTSRAALQQLDPHLAAAARSLGASELRIYLKIIIPSAWPGLIAGTMLAFARSLGEFGASLMLAGSIPGETRTVPMSIYFAVEAGDWQAATFWSICIVLISVAAIFLAEYWLEPLPQPEQRSIQNIGTQKICPVPRSNAALQLELYRNYSNFSLQLQFTSDSTRIAVLGASGSGKSLLLQCMAGLIQADEGKLFWNNRTWFDRQQNIRVSPQQRHVGLVLQDYALFPKLSLIDNISFGIKGLKKAEKRALAMAWLEKFGLTELADRKPSEISGGQRQRIALARALACKPEFLLLDEPFSALDTHIRSQLEQSLMRELHEFPGRLLLVTHSIDEAFRF
ncbi:MAG: ATP-binding cassette domain-containing protein, partial [Proteobacteria bacterium]|nr:ATP-binding cassette domain-containing protein [Pseudomonadota bacterium]